MTQQELLDINVIIIVPKGMMATLVLPLVKKLVKEEKDAVEDPVENPVENHANLVEREENPVKKERKVAAVEDVAVNFFFI